MSTFFYMCVIGILLNSAGIALNSFLLNILGSITICIGAFRLNLEQPIFKKVKFYSVLAIPFSIVAYALTLIPNMDNPMAVAYIALGINTFFFIYFTYYFTESMMDYARSCDELALTRNFRSIWTLCGIIGFLYFMGFNALADIFILVGRIIFLIASVYYCFALNGIAKLFKIK